MKYIVQGWGLAHTKKNNKQNRKDKSIHSGDKLLNTNRRPHTSLSIQSLGKN